MLPFCCLYLLFFSFFERDTVFLFDRFTTFFHYNGRLLFYPILRLLRLTIRVFLHWLVFFHLVNLLRWRLWFCSHIIWVFFNFHFIFWRVIIYHNIRHSFIILIERLRGAWKACGNFLFNLDFLSLIPCWRRGHAARTVAPCYLISLFMLLASSATLSALQILSLIVCVKQS